MAARGTRNLGQILTLFGLHFRASLGLRLIRLSPMLDRHSSYAGLVSVYQLGSTENLVMLASIQDHAMYVMKYRRSELFYTYIMGCSYLKL